MTSYDQNVRVRVAYVSETKQFLSFLNAVGRKYSRHTKVNYRYLGRGHFRVVLDGSPGGIDALFQELLLNKGLYYYLCGLRRGIKRDIADNVVIPVFQDLLEQRFSNPYSKFVRRHLTGKIVDEKYLPGDFESEYSHAYEVLFRKWDIGSLSNVGFIKDLDFLLTQFMLDGINHKPGSKSPKFHILVDLAYRHGLGMAEEIKGLFNEIHTARTTGLHRRQIVIANTRISELAFRLYNFFQYYDEFDLSQKVKTTVLHGRRYQRIRYGQEKWLDENGREYKDDNGNKLFTPDLPCHDCAAIKGQLHCEGCDVEQCPRCHEQYLGCGCKLVKDYK